MPSYSDGGSAPGEGVSGVGRNPNLKDQSVSIFDVAKQAIEAAKAPVRQPDALDQTHDAVVALAGEKLTTKRERNRLARQRAEAKVVAEEVAKIINQAADHADPTPAERAERDALLSRGDNEEEPWESGIAWRHD
jgi:hypothetical protein